MALLSKDEIFSADDRRFEIVKVPEWGGEVRVRSLTGRERDEFESTTYNTKGGKVKENFDNFRARLIAKCVVDEDGKLVFTNRAEIAMLGNKSAAALQRIFNKCQELNGLTNEDVEELTEDFEEEGSGDSTSG
jgi:hypothetical protein